MSNSSKAYRLLAPGPVPVPRAVLDAMNTQVIHHRTPEFERVLDEVWSGLRLMFSTRQPVQILAGTGSAAMEAAVVNLLSPGDEALVVVSGKFGERWAEICEQFGVKTRRWALPWGEPADLDAFADELKRAPHIKAVFTQVCETSTATVHPVREMAALVRRHTSALFACDAITAVGCMPLAMDEWDLDVMIAGSQKAFMIPTGLSFIALSERAWAAQAASRLPKYYFDLRAEKKANAQRQTHFSTPTSLLIGLNIVLRRIREAGPEALIKRCRLLAEVTREAGESLGLGVFSRAPADSVTALNCADSGRAREWLERERGITIMGGQDQLKGKILRVGHMGDVRDDDMAALLSALAEYLHKPLDPRPWLERLRSAPPLFP
jgi:aspartate aminotransferase-like enzyme